MSTLPGKRIALLEGRLPGELADLVRRHGGEPINVPALRERTVECAEQVAAFITRLGQGAIQVVIFSTGVGVAALFREAEQLGRLTELRQGLAGVITVCRGPKPVAALRRQGGAVTVQVAAPYTTAELLAALAGVEVAGHGVALVHYGERNIALTEALQARGAHLHELCLYEWLLPEDVRPLQQLVRELVTGRLDAIAFTSQVQVRHLWQVAATLGLTEALTMALTTHCLVAAVGPTCATALAAVGVQPHVVPTHPKMGPMVTALAAALQARAETDLGRRHDEHGS
jgi:uroporphyrinogen-III synthase